MTRRLLPLACVFALAAVPAFAASPFGGVDGKPSGNQASGIKGISGWALDDSGVESVDIYVDGAIVGRAKYGLHRSGVEAIYPGYPDSLGAGWSFQIDTTQFLNKQHTVQARIRSKTGELFFLPAQSYQFLNTDHNLHPFGLIDFPKDHAEMVGNCTLADPNRRLSTVMGWALDAGVTRQTAGVGYLELLIDGSIYANTRSDCYDFDPLIGGIQCYGQRRMDVEKLYPGLPDSPHAGFRFVLDVGALIAMGYNEGQHVLTIRGGDLYTQDVDVDSIPVTFACDETDKNEGAFGNIASPRPGRMYSNVIAIEGWALDWEGIQRLDIYVDGEFAGATVQFLERPLITSRYPGYPNSLYPGFSYPLDTTVYSDGQHQVQIIAVDTLGGEEMIGERNFYIFNDVPCGAECG